MGTHVGHVMTLSNSIIGVSILAMPFCFKQCGIVLSILMLILSSIISRLTCHYLLKSALMARRRNFEFLAFHIFGPTGKFIVELGIIGFLLGTCIAFFVVVGDIGPAIIAKLLNLEKATDAIRSTFLISAAVFCILPLGLLRNVDSLSSVCTATVGFYLCLVLKIITEAAPHILSEDWITKVEFWRPVGLLQCLPIFSMALACQTQLFEIYDTIPNASLENMNALVRGAVTICTSVYIFVGLFGYIAFCSKPFSGNILMSFTPSVLTDVMKIGFVLSVLFSFPLVIFPCRASLNSLLFRRVQLPHEAGSGYIPENRFKCLTIVIICTSLIIGILIPSIELVLGLVGSTIGIIICILFPTASFICVTLKNTNERILAQVLLAIGIVMMVLGTYANLYAMEEATSATARPLNLLKKEKNIALQMIEENINAVQVKFDEPVLLKEDPEKILNIVKKITEKSVIELPKQKELPKEENNQEKNMLVDNEIKPEPPQPVEVEDVIIKEQTIPPLIIQNEIKDLKIENINKENEVNVNDIKPQNKLELSAKTPPVKLEEVDVEAIKKEDNEIAEEAKLLGKPTESAKELLKIIEKKEKAQEKLFNDTKQILEEVKEQRKEIARQNKIVEMEKRKTAEQIQKIADMAIKSLMKNNMLKNETKSNKKKTEDNQIKDNKSIIVENKLNEILKEPLTNRLGSNIKNKTKDNIIKNEEQQKNNSEKIVQKINNVEKPRMPIPLVQSMKNAQVKKEDKKQDNIIAEIKDNLEINLANAEIKAIKETEKYIEVTSALLLQENKPKVDSVIKQNVINKNETVNNVGRDILSDSENAIREKRDIDSVKEISINVNEKNETCDKKESVLIKDLVQDKPVKLEALNDL